MLTLAKGGRIDFICPATCAEVVIRDLAKATGQDLRVQPDLASDILVIRAKGVEPGDLLARIAKVADAKWESLGATRTLVRSTEAEAESRRRAVADLAVRIDAEIKRVMSSTDFQTPWSEELAGKLARAAERLTDPNSPPPPHAEESFRSLNWQEPSGRAVLRILAEAGGREIADRLEQGRVVFATDPTAMQVGLPNVQGILGEFLAQQMAYEEARKQFAPAEPDGHLMPDGHGFLAGDPKMGIGKAMIRLPGGGCEDSCRASFTTLDSTGSVLTSAFRNLQIGFAASPLIKPSALDPVVQVEPLAKKYLVSVVNLKRLASRSISMYVASGGTSNLVILRRPLALKSGPLSPDLRAWIADPAKNEPMRLCMSPLLQAAEVRQENVVADLDDRSFGLAIRQLDGSQKVSQWLNGPALQPHHEVYEQNGWLTISPRDVRGARLNRVSRLGLGRLMESMLDTRVLTLDRLLEYARSQYAAPSGDQFDLGYMKAAQPAATMDSQEFQKWPLYRFVAELNPDQRAASEKGTLDLGLSVAQPSLLSALRRILFDAGERPTFRHSTRRGAMSQVTDWTQLLPNGIPAGTTARVTGNAAPAAYCLNRDQDAAAMQTITDIARDQYVLKTPELQEYRPSVIFNQYAPAKMQTITFRVTFGIDAFVSGSITGGVLDPSAGPVPYAEMSADFRKSVDDEMVSVSQILSRFPPARVRQATPPP